ncbi:meiosis-specific with OB domain-containing protein isoform X1 [Brienomyrus brachyistius]|uniref:meiosis-specific with OB domain-containing protein isoform X1 n=1 Tax=Brienomyrus brachyistius TaxID=42636 RepID=UPI0020B2E554|nr:meiosis-specific with OB domain-containing protein isoform X1 [Brienomyrus brachyistius]
MTYAVPHMHVAIADLHQNSANLSIIGVVVGKTEVKSFPDRKNIGSERYTFSFTIKDSPDHLINISSWGTEEYINGLSSSFRIGDCVIVEKPLTVTKDPEKDDKFCPSTLSLYRLLLTENHSAIKVLSDTEADSRLLSLFHLPVKDHRDFYSLGDIVANGQSLDGNVINILAVVQSIGEPKYFTTGDGRKGQRCEVKLFDEVIMSFCMICWDRENIQFIQTWIPRETVLFVADARVTFDNFRKSMVATVISKTIITVNPDTKEAAQLFNYARDFAGTGALDDQEKLSGDQVSLDSISDVFTVEQLKVSIQKNLDKQDIIYGIVYAFITTLNLDASVSKVIRNRCSRCWYQVSEDMQNCSNPVCPREAQLAVTTSFDLLVDITDHTGTLQSCTLSGTAAEQTLGYSAEEFVHLKEEDKTALKWKFLLERCKILLKILPSSKTRNGFRGNILSCTLADPGEVKQSFTRVAL